MKKQMMYNEDVKQKFIEDFATQHKDNAKRFFIMSCEKEKQMQADISEWDRESIVGFLNEKAYPSTSQIYANIGAINQYLAWRNVALEPIRMDEIDIVSVNRRHMFASPFEVEKRFNSVFDPIEYNSSNNLLRCIIWLYYMGLSADEIYNMDESQVHVDLRFVEVNGVRYEIPKPALEAFRKCLSVKSFTVYAHRTYVVDRSPGTKFIRFTTNTLNLNTYAKDRYYRNRMSTVFRTRGAKFDLRFYIKSGAFYRQYEIEQMGGIPNMHIIYDELSALHPDDKKGNRYSGSINVITDEYNNWKRAFYVNSTPDVEDNSLEALISKNQQKLLKKIFDSETKIKT